MTHKEKAPRKFLRRGEGAVGRFMKLIEYPVIIRSPSENFESHSVHQESTQYFDSNVPGVSAISPHGTVESNRPVTAGTSDSGFRDDERGPTILTPASDIDANKVKLVVVDVTDDNGSEGSASGICGQSEKSHRSVEIDITLSSEDGTIKGHEKGNNYSSPQSDHLNTVSNSVSEFEKMERYLGLTPSTSSSHLTDGVKSAHWRGVIRRFSKINSPYNQEPDLQSSQISIHSPDVAEYESIQEKICESRQPSSSHMREMRKHNESFLAPFTPMRSAFPSFFEERKSKHQEIKSVNHDGGKQFSSSNSMHSLTEKSFEEVKPANMRFPRASRAFQSTPQTISGRAAATNYQSVTLGKEKNLLTQLRDLIASVDMSHERNNRKIRKMEDYQLRIFNKDERERLKEQRLLAEIERLRQNQITWTERHGLLKEMCEMKAAEIISLKKKLDTIAKKDKSSTDNANEVENLVKQVDELKNNFIDSERRRIDERAQKRKIEAVLKEKDKSIEDLKSMNERLQKHLNSLIDEKAAYRGSRAANFFSNKAISMASNKAPISAATKCTVGRRNVRSAMRRNFNNDVRSRCEVSDVSNEILVPDIDVIDAESQLNPAGIEKNVHWNKPVAAMASMPVNFRKQMGENIDMALERTEDNIVGRASLYKSISGDFVVYTTCHCGCHYYEYGNTDVRWIHSSKRFEIYYYGQVGVTTLRMNDNGILIRHFLTGQLEIYRPNGETTLVKPDGRRTELMRRLTGEYYVERFETDGRVTIINDKGSKTVQRAGKMFSYRDDGSYVWFVGSDDSYEWRAIEYIIRRFKNGDVKIRLTIIDTSVTMMMMDAGTVKHLLGTENPKRYCVEWGTIARKKSRVAACQNSAFHTF